MASRIQAFARSSENKGDAAAEQLAKELAILVDYYPQDVEIRLLMAKPNDRDYEKGEPTARAIYSRAILRDLLYDYPDNPAANHYWIHAIEPGSHPEWALESAEKLARLAPGSGHMVHMPGHIF